MKGIILMILTSMAVVTSFSSLACGVQESSLEVYDCPHAGEGVSCSYSHRGENDVEKSESDDYHKCPHAGEGVSCSYSHSKDGD